MYHISPITIQNADIGRFCKTPNYIITTFSNIQYEHLKYSFFLQYLNIAITVWLKDKAGVILNLSYCHQIPGKDQNQQCVCLLVRSDFSTLSVAFSLRFNNFLKWMSTVVFKHYSKRRKYLSDTIFCSVKLF